MRGLRRPVPDAGEVGSVDSTCFWNGVHIVQGRIETGPSFNKVMDH